MLTLLYTLMKPMFGERRRKFMSNLLQIALDEIQKLNSGEEFLVTFLKVMSGKDLI